MQASLVARAVVVLNCGMPFEVPESGRYLQEYPFKYPFFGEKWKEQQALRITMKASTVEKAAIPCRLDLRLTLCFTLKMQSQYQAG
jgi:hypothetical protein